MERIKERKTCSDGMKVCSSKMFSQSAHEPKQ